MATPPLLVRRLLLAPIVLALEAMLVAAAPLLLALALLTSPLFGGRRPVRVAVIVLSLAWHHLAASLAVMRLWAGAALRGSDRDSLEDALYDVLRSFVSGFYRTVVRVARVSVRVVDSEAAEQALSSGRRPAVMLSRHAGEGDTLLVIHHLLCRYGRRPRIVMHERLRLDPLIDVLGSRLPNRFVDPRGGDTETDIADLARDLDARSALLIFPEGGNSDERRRRRGIERLAEAGHEEEAGWARSMRHLSAPRPGGALAAIEAAPDPVVVFAGHVGIPCSFGEVWQMLPHPQTVELRLWVVPAAEIPAAHDEQIDWLFGWWRTIDAWVSERSAARAAATV